MRLVRLGLVSFVLRDAKRRPEALYIVTSGDGLLGQGMSILLVRGVIFIFTIGLPWPALFFRGKRQAFCRNPRPADVSTQPLELLTFIGPRRDPGV